VNALLLDTHALVWWATDSDRLSATARAAIGDGATRVLVSAASAWELATKVRLGRLPELAAFCADLPAAIAAQSFEPLPVTVEDGRRAGLLPEPHRDPFDRMLIAQALSRELTLVSCESPFDRYGVTRLW
jgi:PIN domain nuclease of toxin-antitoxin system